MTVVARFKYIYVREPMTNINSDDAPPLYNLFLLCCAHPLAQKKKTFLLNFLYINNHDDICRPCLCTKPQFILNYK